MPVSDEVRQLRQRYPGPHRLTVLACNFEGVPIVTVDESDLMETSHA